LPFSESELLSPVVGLIEKIKPTSVLDVGVGFGVYGHLCRTNLEHVNLFEWCDESARKREKEEWQVRIVGVEAFPDYITPVHDYAYNDILIGDARDVLPEIEEQFELVLAVEILEHLEKADGERFLEQIRRISSKDAIVTTPKEFIPQDYPANPYENHRSLWSKEDLHGAGFKTVWDAGTSWIAILGDH